MTGWHLGSVVAGLVFVALGVIFLLDAVGTLDLAARHVWPMLLIGLGMAVLAGGSGERRPTGE